MGVYHTPLTALLSDVQMGVKSWGLFDDLMRDLLGPSAFGFPYGTSPRDTGSTFAPGRIRATSRTISPIRQEKSSYFHERFDSSQPVLPGFWVSTW